MRDNRRYKQAALEREQAFKKLQSEIDIAKNNEREKTKRIEELEM